MIEIKPLRRCDARITIPGSKSYTHRALIAAALADGESVLIDPLASEDTELTLQGLERLGVPVLRKEDRLHVLGRGGELHPGEAEIPAGNSGTSMRFLTAIASLKKGRTLLDGTERMRQRPILPLIEGLEALGARAYCVNGNGNPPVVVESRGLLGGTVSIRGDQSSQFLSALLMVAPCAEKEVHLNVIGPLSSQPYVKITLHVMSAFGVQVDCREFQSFSIRPGQRYRPRTWRIEGDTSNASYFFSAAAITRGKVRVENFNPASLQGDAAFLDVLERMGCHVVRGDTWAEVQGKKLFGVEIDMNAMPDLVPTLAVTAAFTQGRTVIKNIGHLRLKESDRIRSLAEGLSRMGVHAEEGRDWLSVQGGGAHGAEIDTYMDHRLAMSFAVAGLAVPGIRIKEERCVDKSFPGFWEVLQRLYQR